MSTFFGCFYFGNFFLKIKSLCGKKDIQNVNKYRQYWNMNYINLLEKYAIKLKKNHISKFSNAMQCLKFLQNIKILWSETTECASVHLMCFTLSLSLNFSSLLDFNSLPFYINPRYTLQQIWAILNIIYGSKLYCIFSISSVCNVWDNCEQI